ncbi:ferrochelatase [Helicosporidium sp. ATCC 50920]|nr:ferrochelatase [Helicosporidium sp. ATCC 50920]|eukprot:KDD74764.1 ferrochelatase [Helicosporidium sp. ATCC 50920]
MRECVAAVMRQVRALAPERAEAPHTLCFQSRVGPVRWLQPYTDATIRELGRRGTRSVLAVPIAFVSEHIETLEEMDGEYADLARRSGVQHWARVPALNDDSEMIADLASAVEEALRGNARSAQDLHADCADREKQGVAPAPALPKGAATLVLSDRVHGVALESEGAARILRSVARVCAQEMERSKGWWSRARIMMS